MARPTTATMTITRTIDVVTFIDAAGEKTTEPEGMDIEVTVRGSYCRAEPDVGIFSPWFEIEDATDADGHSYDLTDEENERAQNALTEELEDWTED